MELKEAIKARHSVRAYEHKSLDPQTVKALQAKIDEFNNKAHLHIQLIQDEPRAFQGRLAKYGKFSNVTNYLVMAGPKDSNLEERIGYYGEYLVLQAQALGLNTCWVGLSYSKIPGTYTLEDGEKIVCYIALGYGATQGVSHKIKTVEQVSNADASSPEWFRKGVEAALLAPTAINQQKFRFELTAPNKVSAKRFFSLAGYTRTDLGIAKCHFEVGAGADNFVWAD